MINDESLKFHHIGILTSDIEQSKKDFKSFGFSFNKDMFDPIQKVDLSFGVNSDHLLIELVSPRKDSKILNLLKKNGVGPYHICFEVSSIRNLEPILKKEGYLCTLKPTKAIAFDNKLISFYFNKNLGLIELLER